MSKKFKEENSDFIVKLTLIDNDNQTRRIKLSRVFDIEGDISYEELAGLAVRFTFLEDCPEQPAAAAAAAAAKEDPFSKYKIRLTYNDIESDLIHLGSTDELLDAVEQYKKQRFVHIFASVERKKQRQRPEEEEQQHYYGEESPDSSRGTTCVSDEISTSIDTINHRSNANICTRMDSSSSISSLHNQNVVGSIIQILSASSVIIHVSDNKTDKILSRNKQKGDSKVSTEEKPHVKHEHDAGRETKNNEPLLFIHRSYKCNSCLVKPIVGKRYHAVDLPDYDLCKQCIHNCKVEKVRFEVIEREITPSQIQDNENNDECSKVIKLDGTNKNDEGLVSKEIKNNRASIKIEDAYHQKISLSSFQTTAKPVNIPPTEIYQGKESFQPNEVIVEEKSREVKPEEEHNRERETISYEPITYRKPIRFVKPIARMRYFATNSSDDNLFEKTLSNKTNDGTPPQNRQPRLSRKQKRKLIVPKTSDINKNLSIPLQNIQPPKPKVGSAIMEDSEVVNANERRCIRDGIQIRKVKKTARSSSSASKGLNTCEKLNIDALLGKRAAAKLENNRKAIDFCRRPEGAFIEVDSKKIRNKNKRSRAGSTRIKKNLDVPPVKSNATQKKRSAADQRIRMALGRNNISILKDDNAAATFNIGVREINSRADRKTARTKLMKKSRNKVVTEINTKKFPEQNKHVHSVVKEFSFAACVGEACNRITLKMMKKNDAVSAASSSPIDEEQIGIQTSGGKKVQRILTKTANASFSSNQNRPKEDETDVTHIVNVLCSSREQFRHRRKNAIDDTCIREKGTIVPSAKENIDDEDRMKTVEFEDKKINITDKKIEDSKTEEKYDDGEAFANGGGISSKIKTSTSVDHATAENVKLPNDGVDEDKESSASEIEENGSEAELLRETLDTCATYIEDVAAEIDRSSRASTKNKDDEDSYKSESREYEISKDGYEDYISFVKGLLKSESPAHEIVKDGYEDYISFVKGGPKKKEIPKIVGKEKKLSENEYEEKETMLTEIVDAVDSLKEKVTHNDTPAIDDTQEGSSGATTINSSNVQQEVKAGELDYSDDRWQVVNAENYNIDCGNKDTSCVAPSIISSLSNIDSEPGLDYYREVIGFPDLNDKKLSPVVIQREKDDKLIKMVPFQGSGTPNGDGLVANLLLKMEYSQARSDIETNNKNELQVVTEAEMAYEKMLKMLDGKIEVS